MPFRLSYVAKYVAINIIITFFSILAAIAWAPAASAANEDIWFEQFKRTATDEQLYRFLYAMPKGGDLHNHSSGSNFPSWWYELATNENQNGGYRYYTKTSHKSCRNHRDDNVQSNQKTLLFINIQQSTFSALDKCEQSEFSLLSSLNTEQKQAWLNSIWLDKPHEGREEFFEAHWQRLNQLTANPFIAADMLVKNMQALAAEGVLYLETQASAYRYLRADGSSYSAMDVAQLFRDRLMQKDALDTQVTVRLQQAILRFLPDAEQLLAQSYQFVDKNRDLYVGLNIVGREDNQQGNPLRFLSTLRKLRATLPEVKLAFHAGEAVEPNSNIRDTLLLGADRIGHGLNLIKDPNTLLLMRHNRFLVEINLISNFKLGYVSNLAEHPFPEYLRIGIPVALSTDDRGMWHSNLTDEFFVAVKEFGLNWSEIIKLSENSIHYSFVEEKVKSRLLEAYSQNLAAFSRKLINTEKTSTSPIVSGHFICQNYQICLNDIQNKV